ncbi:hypothetical protein HZS_5083 [Henneguya salminicola]|nr:hypothetical protein HZS_5083 [Henneguya salminicola]
MHLRMMTIAKHHLENVEHHQVLGTFISPVHDGYGKKGLLSSEHRINMIKGAIEDKSKTYLDEWEASQPAYSNTIAVLEHASRDIVQSNGQFKNSKIRIIIGMDLLESFLHKNIWSLEDVEHILLNYSPVVIHRDELNPDEIIKKSEILLKYRHHLLFIEDSFKSNIASTLIRDLLSKNMPIDYLVDAKTHQYIKKHNLYKN